MPVGMALELLQKADLHIFTTQAGAVECWPHDLQDPTQEVCFLNNWTMNNMPAASAKYTTLQEDVLK